MNHEEFFKSILVNGCPECKEIDFFKIQRRIEETIDYDEYWGIEDDGFQLNSKEDCDREKRVIWYVAQCDSCEYERNVDDLDLLIEASHDHDGTNINEESFFKEVEAQ